MRSEPITPARLAFEGGEPYGVDYGDRYHAQGGAQAQCAQVFLAGNGLPARWRGRTHFAVLETGFGLGQNFLATCAAWRADPARSARLTYVGIDKHPPTRADLARALAASPHAAHAAALVAAWPPTVCGLHRLTLEGGAITLHLAWGDVARWLPELVGGIDAFYFDGFAPARNPAMWAPRLWASCARLAAPGATAATWCAASAVRRGLAAAGFAVAAAPGFGGKREMTAAHWPGLPHCPGAALPRPAGRRGTPEARHVAVVGAGLAGAAAAQALARRGLRVTVLEAEAEPAAQASGNPAGLFHGTVHPHDGPHAQLLRAAALQATARYAPLVAAGAVGGAADGLARLTDLDPAALTAWASRLGLPAEWVQPLAAAEATARLGTPVAGPAWWFTGGGWLSPQALVRHWLATPGVALRTGARVTGLAQTDGGWRVQISGGAAIDADAVVIAGALDGLALLAPWADAPAAAAAPPNADSLRPAMAPVGPCAPFAPVRRTRGQITWLPSGHGLPTPRHPVASGAYALALPDGRWLCGATAQDGDDDAAVRPGDHAQNLARAAALFGLPPPGLEVAARAEGRVGWRLTTDDRLPLVGPLPLPAAQRLGLARQEQPRHVPRVPGLYVLTALGSRGLTWAPLLGEQLAAWLLEEPWPLPASLADAIDAARFTTRAVRRAARVPSA